MGSKRTASATADRKKGPLRRLAQPIERFLEIEAASGIALLSAALVALVWANSPWSATYGAVWNLSLGELKTPHFLVNDVLMVFFFFVVGIEIRREIHGGELSDLKRAALPLFAALGGMIAPALVFLSLNLGQKAQRGWGVPTATDIAFAVGVVTLLGKRVPHGLHVLLLAIAIVDDIGAIAVIALFYSTGFSILGIGVALVGLGGVFAFRRLGVRKPSFYVLPGALMWFGCLRAGIHPALVGVGLGLLTPIAAEEGSRSPAQRLEHAIHPWVAFAIMPLFALANAGVSFRSTELGTPEALRAFSGVLVGLVLGKPLGVLAASYAAAKLGLCQLPRGVDVRGLALVGAAAGIGFTMAVFIAELAFADSPSLQVAKLGVLAGSAIAGALTLAWGRWVLPK